MDLPRALGSLRPNTTQKGMFGKFHLARKLVERLPSPRPRRAGSKGAAERKAEQGKLIIELPEESPSCIVCHRHDTSCDLRGLSCGHRFCQECLTQRAKKIAEGVCPFFGCEQTLSTEEVQSLVGAEVYRQMQMQADEAAAAAMQQELDAQEQRELHARRHFRCPLCFDEVAKRDAFELDCGHWHCQGCLCEFLKCKISEAQVSEKDLACPIPGCGQVLSEVQIQSITAGTSLWDRFLEFRAREWRPSLDDGRMATCPSPDCERFEVPPDTEFARCPRCSKDFCVKCGGGVHKGMSCEDYQAWQVDNDASARLMEELLQKEDWRRCPRCGVPSQRESGCNFMRCVSSTCKNSRESNAWCYVCGGKLNTLDHFTHYPAGPFGNSCFGQRDRVTV